MALLRSIMFLLFIGTSSSLRLQMSMNAKRHGFFSRVLDRAIAVSNLDADTMVSDTVCNPTSGYEPTITTSQMTLARELTERVGYLPNEVSSSTFDPSNAGRFLLPNTPGKYSLYADTPAEVKVKAE
uniref:Uncharacterized protein n=1 Tax=Octactis speculum TaxID=3111310 RepID=A0A7S2F7S9_9STRA|mmetsp:Transcript_15327/g.20571  ORF Transcript_15327/g.20571 Transcript_15327/m.20571 type:complete len:127 (+) Transcript_15327:32-412(+)|eukprot:CAMPEP_0185766284 /NCGR_PEP_ID=MMETSP1174-20130828/35822_1 /TAXON_ID=35687 /ORGANISM="Dictyocha speculum, Strain CCMP1381" /LENGTH=126 /DNA_ID=CAMNT_0028449869 /DNA_START=32 /DNA_END=412 /DNA_ORIENTATION=+